MFFPLDKPFLIAGPCLLESEELGLRVGDEMKKICEDLGWGYLFKASFDKANRSSIESARGPGLEEGLRSFERIKARLGVPVLTDIHNPAMAHQVKGIVDVVQIPAFMARQTDFYVEAAKAGLPVNAKKAQFMAPGEMRYAVEKYRESGGTEIAVCERGTTFGYGNLVVDFRSVPIVRSLGVPYVFDASHSTQLPAVRGGSSGGDRRFLPVLARAQMIAGADGLFLEVHPDPANAWSDRETQWPIEHARKLLTELDRLYRVARELSTFDVE